MSVEEDYDDEATALYRKCAGKVQGFLINMGCDQGLAEEITDDAFLGARHRWVYVRTLDEPEATSSRLRGTNAANGRRNMRVKRKISIRIHRGTAGTDDDPAQDVADRAVVRQALQQLPSSQREAVTLRDVADLSEAVTAEVMGVSAGSVKRYTSEGRQKLRLLLAEFRPRREGNDR